jgi:hypothetical protein
MRCRFSCRLRPSCKFPAPFCRCESITLYSSTRIDGFQIKKCLGRKDERWRTQGTVTSTPWTIIKKRHSTHTVCRAEPR